MEQFNREQALKKKAEIDFNLHNGITKCTKCDVLYQGEHSCPAETASCINKTNNGGETNGK